MDWAAALLRDRVRKVLESGSSFDSAPFFEADIWHLLETDEVFEVGAMWPSSTLKNLASAECAERAAEADGVTILLLLRNALAHGGITYLDEDGMHTESATFMLGFVSEWRHDGNTGFRLLRVPVEGFQRFLLRWTEWLLFSGVAEELNHCGPGYFERELGHAESA